MKPVSSASVVLVQKCKESNGEDYKVLLIKRNSNVLYGGAFAFPGGKFDEEEDELLEKWEGLECNRHHIDNSLRLTAVRELYEETGIFIGKDGLHVESHKSRHSKEGGFSRFCRELGKEPGIDHLMPIVRLGSSFYYFPRISVQMYLYFIDSHEKVRVQPETNEFTHFEWLSPREALLKFEEGSLPMGGAQLFVLI